MFAAAFFVVSSDKKAGIAPAVLFIQNLVAADSRQIGELLTQVSASGSELADQGIECSELRAITGLHHIHASLERDFLLVDVFQLRVKTFLLGGNAPSYDAFLQVRRQLMAQKMHPAALKSKVERHRCKVSDARPLPARRTAEDINQLLPEHLKVEC